MSRMLRAIFFLLSALQLLVVALPSVKAQDVQSVAPATDAKSYPQPADPPASLPHDFIPLEVNEFRTPIAKPLDSKLRGPGVQLIGISKEMTLLNDGSEDSRPCHGCLAVKVRIVNEGSEPIVVDGNNARAFSSGQEFPAWSEEKVLKTSGSVLSGPQKLALAGAAISTLGLAEPILQDHFTTSKKTLLKSYGDIVIRRRLEDIRLAKRIILPNEDTVANVFFPDQAQPFDKIVIPLMNYPGGEPCGSLSLDASKATVGVGDHQK